MTPLELSQIIANYSALAAAVIALLTLGAVIQGSLKKMALAKMA